jgi:hypothetical protein
MTIEFCPSVSVTSMSNASSLLTPMFAKAVAGTRGKRSARWPLTSTEPPTSPRVNMPESAMAPFTVTTF